MNTPTPAQALGDIGHWLCKYSDDGRYMNLNGPLSSQCFEVGQKLIQHGQHFAGLAERYEAAALLGREAVEQFDAMRSRAEAAEAQRAELEDKYASVVARYDAAADKLLAMQDRAHAAESRVRKAEGLLRDARDSIVKATMAAAGYVPEPEPGTIMHRVAAFLSARGERHE